MSFRSRVIGILFAGFLDQACVLFEFFHNKAYGNTLLLRDSFCLVQKLLLYSLSLTLM